MNRIEIQIHVKNQKHIKAMNRRQGELPSMSTRVKTEEGGETYEEGETEG